MSTRKLTLTGLLAAVALALQATGVGFLPVPTPGGAITILHIPAIVAGIVAGPWSGAVVGGIFGAYTFMHYAPPDPLVHIVPRLLIGPMAWLVYRAALRLPEATPMVRAGIAALCLGVLPTAALTWYMAMTWGGLLPPGVAGSLAALATLAVAALVFRQAARAALDPRSYAAALAAAVATLFHTASVTALAVGLGWFPAAAMVPVAAIHGPLEAGAAVLLTVPIVRALSRRSPAVAMGRSL